MVYILLPIIIMVRVTNYFGIVFILIVFDIFLCFFFIFMLLLLVETINNNNDDSIFNEKSVHHKKNYSLNWLQKSRQPHR